MNQFKNALLQEAGTQQTVGMVVVLAGMIVVVGSALGFEHLGGYAPCALCLEQRNPYYWGIPLLAIGVLSSIGGFRWPGYVIRGLLLIGFFCMLATAALGVYHSGVEWGYFDAPLSCGAGLSATSSDAGNLLDSLATAKPPSCADAAGRFLGLSFAGWNVLAAAALALIALRSALGKGSRAG